MDGWMVKEKIQRSHIDSWLKSLCTDLFEFSINRERSSILFYLVDLSGHPVSTVVEQMV